ncbi:MAG: hypothetical protein Alpg2KO_11940 [Alphaproteobacteria bacterium]
MNLILDNPLYHIPNYILAAMFWTLLGRALLGLLVPEGWDNYIWRGFRLITDPAVRLARLLSPQVMPDGVMVLVAAGWIWLLRIMFTLWMGAGGMLPEVTISDPSSTPAVSPSVEVQPSPVTEEGAQ